MTNLDRKIKAVGVFFALTVAYLLFSKDKSVFWAIYSFCLKDLMIIFFALSAIKKSYSSLENLLLIGLSCYLSVPTLIRLSCAVKSDFVYLKYRELMCNSEYSYFLLLVLFFIATLIYYERRNGRTN